METETYQVFDRRCPKCAGREVAAVLDKGEVVIFYCQNCKHRWEYPLHGHSRYTYRSNPDIVIDEAKTFFENQIGIDVQEYLNELIRMSYQMNKKRGGKNV